MPLAGAPVHMTCPRFGFRFREGESEDTQVRSVYSAVIVLFGAGVT
ncbi:Hypothetical protein PFR_JS13-1_1468 [Propionibacterium freudenreichii]|nr:Hypothetical protein PFR_JS11_1468 [Propionibacterium freudenreichii]SCQ49039.1 Hypothetical protein PFR_JS13-1_1468 [Propionibacterium freudenreichii]